MDNASAFGAISWLAVVIAAVAMFVLGGLWYGPLFGRTWMRGSGMTEERAKQGSPARTFGVSFVLVLLAAIVLEMFLGPETTAAFGLSAGAAVGVFWVATLLGVVYLFEQRPLGHWLVNAGYAAVGFAMMGAILGAL